jgi:hypothetical protein
LRNLSLFFLHATYHVQIPPIRYNYISGATTPRAKMPEHANHPWQYVGPALLLGIPVLTSAGFCIYAQLKWPYTTPPKTKDHESQHQGGINMTTGEQAAIEESGELLQRPASRTRRAEEGLEDPDVITALPSIPTT